MKAPWLAVVLAAPLALVAAPTSARAQTAQTAQTAPPAPPADTRERATDVWYGWQTLLAVVPFDIAMFVGLAQRDAPYGTGLFTAGFVGRNLAPAVVHLAHRRPGLAFGTVGLHAAATATGLVIGYAVGLAIQENCPLRSPCRNGFRELPPGPGYGAVAGSMVGTLLDVLLLARSPRSSWESTRTASTFTVVPYAAPTGVGLAAGGTF